jgi:uncharacterized protein (TIGR02284 family)
LSSLALARLNDLAKLIGDAKRGIETVNDDADGNRLLQTLFNQLIEMHEKHFMKLTEMMKQHGSQEIDSGTIAGALHRTWLDLKASITDGSPEAILEGVYFGERYLYSRYDDVLSELTFPQEWQKERDSLARQRQELAEALNKVKQTYEAFEKQPS